MMLTRPAAITVLLALLALFFFGAPASSRSQEPAPASGVIPHQLEPNGDRVEFELPADVMRLHLQGQRSRTGEWVNLALRNNPDKSLSSLKVPPGWRSAALRVWVTYIPDSAKRVSIPSMLRTGRREVVFQTGRKAKLYSIESLSPGATEWTRISTVAAPDKPKTIRVPLPSSFQEGSAVRVIAVRGESYPSSDLNVRLPSQMRGGPTKFSARLQEVLSRPLIDGEVSALAAATGDAKGSAPAAVQESDIWKIRGKKIYFFNRLRGLQIIDTESVGSENAPGPLMAGSLSLPGAGEEMYLIGGDESAARSALLIAGLPWNPSNKEATRLHKIDLLDDKPVPESSLDLPGYYVESRLIGGILHVVTASWGLDSGRWSPRTFITTVDVSQSGTLVASPAIELATSPHAVGSTGNYLWVAASSGESWWQHRLTAFPYKTDGTLADPLSADLGGIVQDKFKVGDTADGLAVVTMNWQSWQRITSVETFREDNGQLVRAAAPLEIIRNESLFASSFDGGRLYVVTFAQVDPLWIVDLSDPSNPEVLGHLEVPGWSNYIQPMGDVLLAVGRDGGKVQVSMFDVKDPQKPVRTGLVDLGSADGWSWTEGEWNEKAVKILPEAGLMLVPVVEWIQGAQRKSVALVDFDLSARTLHERGRINHDFSPRRAALMDDAMIASVSNRELLLVDASDRNQPSTICEVALAFGVDRAVVCGETLLMFENGGAAWSGGPQRAMLRTAPADDTDDVVEELQLPCTEVSAAAVLDGRLLLVESGSPALSIWSLENPTLPALIGRTALPFDPEPDTDILSVEGGRVAIVSRSRGWSHLLRPMPLPLNGVLAGSARLSLPWIGWGNQSLHIAVADLAGPAPLILGNWQLEGEGLSNISQVYSAQDLLVFSYDFPDEATTGTDDGAFWNVGWKSWNTRSWLQILDLANPSSPMPWAPVELPGSLIGVPRMHRTGGVVFARTQGGVAALGFDGEKASLAGEVAAGGVVVSQDTSLYSASDQGVKEWAFSENDASWQEQEGWSFATSQAIRSLHMADGALLAGGYGSVWILGEDGSVQTCSIPVSADLAGAEQDGSSFVISSGEFGVIRVP